MTSYSRSLCVFCGSRFGDDPTFKAEAQTLGKLMAENGIRLVYGGGSVGLMGVVADSVMKAGGTVLGIIPDFLHDKEVGHEGLSELVIAPSMHERKKRMFDESDGFVVLPGGLGTLDETFEILTWKQLNLHQKPVFILDTGNYWAPFDALVKATINNGFASESALDLYSIEQSAQAIIDQTTSLTPEGNTQSDRF